MAIEDLTNYLEKGILDTKNLILVTDLMEKFGPLSYEETNNALENFICKEEKRGVEFKKKYLIHGVEEDSGDEVYWIIADKSKLKDVSSLKQVKISLYSVEGESGSRTILTELLPFSHPYQKLNQLVVNNNNILDSLNAEEAAELHVLDNKPSTDKKKNTSQEKQIESKPIVKRDIGNFFTTTSVKAENKKAQTDTNDKPSTSAKKSSDFFKPKTEKKIKLENEQEKESLVKKDSIPVNIFAPSVKKTEVNIVENKDTEDNKLNVKSNKNNVKTAPSKRENNVDSDDEDVKSRRLSKRRRISDSDQDDDGFVTTIKKKTLQEEAPTTKKSPIKKTASATSKANKKGKKQSSTLKPKTKQANIQSFFGKK